MEKIGEILDAAEGIATPSLIKLCVKEIEKEGQAEFKVFGKKHTLSIGMICLCLEYASAANGCDYSDKPSTLPETRPPASSHDPEPTSSACSKRVQGCLRASVVTSPITPIPTERKLCCCMCGVISDAIVSLDPGTTSTCDGARWPQPCQHYSSVINYHQPFLEDDEPGYNPLTCPATPLDNARRGGADAQVTYDWTKQHDDGW